jgi:hypothetical protein
VLSEKDLELLGIGFEPLGDISLRLRTLIDSGVSPSMRIVAEVAEARLTEIGVRLSDANADVDRLAKESYFWRNAPSVYLIVAREIAKRLTDPREERDTSIDA